MSDGPAPRDAVTRPARDRAPVAAAGTGPAAPPAASAVGTRSAGGEELALRDGVVLREVRDDADMGGARELRLRVFCDEQGVTHEDEFDGRDGEARHWIAVAPGGAVVGTARLLGGGPGQDALLGRMAVDAAWRGRGLAGAILAAADAAAAATGAPGTRLMAQLPAVAVYERGGYVVTSSDAVMDAGIEHRRMRRDFTAPR